MRISLPLPIPVIIAALALQATGSLASDEAARVGGASSPEADDRTVYQVSLTDRRAAGREHLKQLTAEQRYDEAIPVALQILRLTQEEFGETARQIISPLIELADVQRHGKEINAAEQNLSAAIRLIEKYDGPISLRLLEPLTMLGQIQNETWQYKQAIETFNRALRVNHINLGFKNSEQFPIMDGLSESHASLDDLEEATFYQQSQLEIQQRKLGMDNPEIAPAYYKLARWYFRTKDYDDAIHTYLKADRIIQSARGKNSTDRVEALLQLALVYQQIGNGASASSALRRALRLIEESPENDPQNKASVLVALGDNLTRSGRFSQAQDRYAAAWRALPDDDEGTKLREHYFSRPVRIEGNLFPRYAHGARGHDAEAIKTGSILINYSIDARGRVMDASIVESDPPGLMDRTFLSIYRNSLFRPHFVNGDAEPCGGLLLEHEFFYLDKGKDQDEESNPDSGKLKYPGKD